MERWSSRETTAAALARSSGSSATTWEKGSPSPAPSEDGEPGPLPLSGDELFEEALQRYLELRLVKRPPEGAHGAARKVTVWLETEAQQRGHALGKDWRERLARGFLEVEADVAEANARRRQSRRRERGPEARVSR
jgi:hypothetical protein